MGDERMSIWPRKIVGDFRGKSSKMKPLLQKSSAQKFETDDETRRAYSN